MRGKETLFSIITLSFFKLNNRSRNIYSYLFRQISNYYFYPIGLV